MRDRINRIAKGINELETPEIKIIPESVSLCIKADVEESFIIELTSKNGFSIKGACFSDELRVRPEQSTFAGRHIHLAVGVNTVGLCEGDILTGGLEFITNAGEFTYEYSFEIEKNVEAACAANETNLSGEFCKINYNGREKKSFDETAKPELPEDDGELERLAIRLINAKDESCEAFFVYREAVRRHLSITHLYESYMLSYPDGCRERLPREVLLYFSYDSEISPEIAEKLYCDIIRHETSDTELFDSFSAQMSAFAMSSALSGRINERLSLIYDRMIYEDMLDKRAAEVIPDILKCLRYEITDGRADKIYVCYKELNTFFEGRVTDGIAYVPVFFPDAEIRFGADYEDFDDSGKSVIRTEDVTNIIKYSKKGVFNKPELLKRCFEINPKHPMLLLSACRNIVSSGIQDIEEKELLIKGLSELNLSRKFRKEIIAALCIAGFDLSWLGLLNEDDYDKDSCRDIFSAFIRSEKCPAGYNLIKHFGMDAIENTDLRKMAEGLIAEEAESIKTDSTLLTICKRLFDSSMASDDMLKLLAGEYSGSIEEMLRIFEEAVKKGFSVRGISEKILTFELFTGSSRQIDKVFKAYAESGISEDIVIRAYLVRRSTEYFLYERDIDGDILFKALFSYISGLKDEFMLPVICYIALTAYYADREELDDKELVLCQRITDKLIADGLIFRYTKKLRKKIHIPEEICWKYYIEYHAKTEEPPRLLVRIMPDDETYHTAEMKRVFKNVFVAPFILFTGDELHYLIYDRPSSSELSEEGNIKVTKLHRQCGNRVRALNKMMKAIETEDEELLKESMLSYVENAETVRALFKPENQDGIKYRH